MNLNGIKEATSKILQQHEITYYLNANEMIEKSYGSLTVCNPNKTLVADYRTNFNAVVINICFLNCYKHTVLSLFIVSEPE